MQPFFNPTFNCPISNATADRLIESLDSPSDVLDVGCGRAEFLIRIAARYSCRGVGVDPNEALIASARRTIAEREAAGRIELHAERIHDVALGRFDLGLCTGATHAFGEKQQAFIGTLDYFKEHLTPGGRLIVGEGFWNQPPPEEYLAVLGGSRDELVPHETNVQRAHEAGYEVRDARRSEIDEWEAFEAEFLAAGEREFAGDPKRLKARRSWNAAFHQWGRHTLGFCLYDLILPDPDA